MISTITYYINIQHKDNPQKFDTFPILGMKMEGYPEPVISLVTYHDGKVEKEIKWDGNKMGIVENPQTENQIKIRMGLNGGVVLQPNRNFSDLEVFGILELAKAQFTKQVFDRSDRATMAKN
jgi:hypothetical protein